jgi:hypothetical protein
MGSVFGTMFDLKKEKEDKEKVKELMFEKKEKIIHCSCLVFGQRQACSV